MSSTAIKICGIAAPDALDAAIAARAEHVGFVFFERSPRNVSIQDAARLAQRAAGRIGKVGLFVDADDAAIADGVAAGQLDAIQLHGTETPQRAAHVKAQFGLPVWKALSVATAADVERAEMYRGAADMVLFDAKTPKGTLPGGMGLVFDWTLLSAYRGALPWGLAGGLNPENVAEAVRRTRALLVDCSSGVESEPGRKDIDKIAAFCQAARS
ncbi:phosphoribosylanthranilate isomerase [Altericroceibacterium xinjiangense]|uniref:phosphoribosylanthranilate isomerase n=1 Tax=Altericroceibacterium xinjiangense TaxID=762261 RepID=UPI000F7EA91B|nr:phosphoribosylanthranilate isomerase [Altericroceibacterium xinjiangense]